MKQYISLLKNTKMFSGINEKEILSILDCLHATIKNYKKNELVLYQGEPVHSIGMVLSGIVLIEKEDFWGNRLILQELLPGTLFAESYACLKTMPIETNVFAKEPAAIMFFDINRIFHICSKTCSFHTRLIENLLATIAEKNVALTRKIQLISQKTIRDRLLSYLSAVSQTIGSSKFSIPFNRQELADYLSVDRSALSNEISKLQKEGIFTCQKNNFVLHTDIEIR